MNLGNIFKIPELRKRIFFTLGMLLVYRLGVFITVPGINRARWTEYVNTSGNALLGVFNLFSGGALEQASIFMLGIMPYVSASIVVQLLSFVVPTFEEARKEGESGTRRLNQYTRYLTVVIAIVQAYIAATNQFERQNNVLGVGDLVASPGWGFRIMTVISLTTGTAFIMWLSEQITERGIGNGSSLIIFAGIVADMPSSILNTFSNLQSGQIKPISLLIVVGIVVGMVALISFVERGQRRIPIQHSRRNVGGKAVAAQTQPLPLRVNMAGVIPPIFASTVITAPASLVSWVPSLEKFANVLQRGWVFNVLFALLIIFFAFFYVGATFQPVDMANNLEKQNAFVPRVRPGKETADYLQSVVTKLTLIGGVYLAFVCILPQFLQEQFRVPFFLGGTSVIIVVGVALDTMAQIESHLITRNYEGLLGSDGPRIRGRAGRVPAASSALSDGEA